MDLKDEAPQPTKMEGGLPQLCIYCNDHGVELKAKASPLIGNAMFWI